MEEKVRKAHAVARELADGTAQDTAAEYRWQLIYNSVFQAMLVETLPIRFLGGTEKQPEGE